MRPLIVAIAIILLAVGLLVWSGVLDSQSGDETTYPAAGGQAGDVQDRFEVDSGMASDTDPVSNNVAEGP